MRSLPDDKRSFWAVASGVSVVIGPSCAFSVSWAALEWLPLGPEDPDLIAAGIGLIIWVLVTVAGLAMGIVSVVRSEPRGSLSRVAIGMHVLVLLAIAALCCVGVQ